MINKTLCFIAGVDYETLQKCSPTDRIWASHIGAMLLFAFIVVSGVSYLSFDYLGSISTSIDPETNKVSFVKLTRTFESVTIGAIIAFIIAFLITLFDRAIFISDWYYQPIYGLNSKRNLPGSALVILVPAVFLLLAINWPFIYGNSLRYFSDSFDGSTSLIFQVISATIIACNLAVIFYIFYRNFSKSKGMSGFLPSMGELPPTPNLLQKMLRVSIRLTVSVFVAFALSTFLELRVYETNILSTLSKWHFEENESIYQTYSERLNAIESSIDPHIQSVERAQNAVDNLTQASAGDISEALDKINNEIKLLVNQYRKDEAELILERSSKLDPFQKRLTLIRDSASQIQEKITYYKRREAEELTGTNDLNDPNASNSAGDGDLAESARSQAIALLSLKKEKDDEISRLVEDIDTINSLYEQRLKTRLSAFDDQRNLLAADKKAITERQVSNSDDLQLQLASAQARLKLATEGLEGAREAQAIDFENARKALLEHPEFSPLQAGPLERLKALQYIKSSEKFGEIISRYTLILKLFVIFLEVVPVATKIFFSPPSLYATIVQTTLFASNVNILSDLNRTSITSKNSALDQTVDYLSKYAEISETIISMSKKQKETIVRARESMNNLHDEEIRFATNIDFHREMMDRVLKEVVENFTKSKK